MNAWLLSNVSATLITNYTIIVFFFLTSSSLQQIVHSYYEKKTIMSRKFNNTIKNWRKHLVVFNCISSFVVCLLFLFVSVFFLFFFLFCFLGFFIICYNVLMEWESFTLNMWLLFWRQKMYCLK
jgi:hypothetical protein